MSQSHQRRTSLKGTPQASFYIDVEKTETADPDQMEEQNYSRVIFIVVFWFCWLMLAAAGVSFGLSVSKYHGLAKRPPTETSNPIINVIGDANEEYTLRLNEFYSDKKTVDLDIAAMKTEEGEEDPLNSQLDLKEILSVSPIILLSEDPDSEDQQQLELIIKNLNIHPEPKIVNLDKHPHCKKILKYLRSYKSHQDAPTAPVATAEASIKSDLKFNQDEMGLDSDNESSEVNYEVLRYKSEQKLAENHSSHSIPRLFIGGVPYGNYQELFHKHRTNALAKFLREKGRGLITVG